MTASALFWLTYGPVAFAAVAGMAADMAGARRSSHIGVALLLAASGTTALVAGWSMDPAVAVKAFNVGGYASTVPGAILLCAALAVFAEQDSAHMPVLASLAAGGAALALSATDLVAMVLCLELAGMTGYALVSSKRSRLADEAAMKYFVQGAVSTGLFVFGLAIVIGLAAPDGTLSSIAAAIDSKPALASVLSMAVLLVIASLSFKAGAAPFHSWAPDAYQHAPASGAAVMAGGVKLGMIAAIGIVVAWVQAAGSGGALYGAVGHDLMYALGGLGLLSVALGSTVALKTDSYARMIGYAGVAQVGYALIAMAALVPAAAIVFGVTYAIGVTGALVAGGVFLRLRPEWDGTISGLGGMARTAPVSSAALTIVLMSLAGIPPLFGFWGKLQAFGSALSMALRYSSEGQPGTAVWLGSLVAAGVLGSIVSLGYYGSVVRALYFDSSPEAESAGADGPEHAGEDAATSSATVSLVLSAALVIVVGLVPMVLGMSAVIYGFVLR